MNASRLLILLAFLVTLSCKKRPSDPPKDIVPLTGKVIINNEEYPTVKVGNQIWTSTNYKGAGGIAGNKPEYGKYYTFEEMKQIILPQGWRVPSENDYQKLIASAGMVWQNNAITNPQLIRQLGSSSGWKNVQGNNASGFNLYPGGYSVSNTVPLDGDLGELWMDDGKTFCIMESGNLTSHRIIFYAKSPAPDRFNLRLVQDTP
jgi:uncharacterized protein (TIGR02145 family)